MSKIRNNMENRVSRFFGFLEEAIKDLKVNMKELKEIAGSLDFSVDVAIDERSNALYSFFMKDTQIPVAHFVDSRIKRRTIEGIGYSLAAGISLNDMNLPEIINFEKLKPHIKPGKSIFIRLQKPTAIDPLYFAELYLPKI